METAKSHYFKNPEQIRIFDTTLRDGRQAPECDMTQEDALAVARALDDGLRVDIIEAGVPVDTFERELVQAVGEQTRYSTIAAFARAGNLGDIDSSFQVLQKPLSENRARVALLSRMAKRLRGVKGLTEEEAIEEASRGMRHTIKHFNELGLPPDIHVYFEGASETDVKLLMEATRQLMNDALNNIDPAMLERTSLTFDYPDTHGTSRGGSYGEKIDALTVMLEEQESPMDAVVAAHCHNDYGQAVANTMEAVRHGATQVDGTILGIGERTGNADLIQVLGNLHYLDPDFPLHRTRLDQCYDTAVVVSNAVNQPIPRNHPFIGKYVASTAAGIHADLVRKDSSAYNTVDPRLFGAPTQLIELGPMMGKGGIDHVLKQEGIYLPGAVVKKITTDFREQADKRMEVDEFIERFVETREVAKMTEKLNGNQIKLNRVRYSHEEDDEGERDSIEFTVSMNGNEVHSEAESHSTVIGVLEKAIGELTGEKFEVAEYNSKAVEAGGAAEVLSKMKVRWEGENGPEERVGYGISNQTNKANIKAFLTAIKTFSFWEKGREA